MNNDQLSALVIRGVFPILLGVYMSLLAFRVIGRKPGEHQKWDEWHRRCGLLLKVVGPLGILTGVFLVVNVLFFTPQPLLPSGAWARAYTDDQRFSAEFPEPPQRSTETVQTVGYHSLTLQRRARKSAFSIDFSDLPDQLRGMDEERLLDAARDAVLESGGQSGKRAELVWEEKLSEPSPPGRYFLVSSSDSCTQRVKVFIVGVRCYRAIAITPPNPQDEADGQRFVDSARFERTDK